MKVKPWMTIPNLLSAFRILLVPAFIVSYQSLGSSDRFALWPVLILAVSGITDLFDGMIARHFNQVSDLGKVLDPIADKLTQVSVLICLAIRFQDRWEFWLLLSIYVLKEGLIMVGGLVMLKGKRQQVPQAKWFGKLATFEFYAAMLLMLVFPGMPAWLMTVLVLITAVLAAFSLCMYIIGFCREQFAGKRDPKLN